MDNLQNNDEKAFDESNDIEFEVETDNLVESLIRNVVKGYQEAYNKAHPKNEIKFTMTITNHKVPTPDGNKTVAYLRLDRSVREKGPNKIIQEEGKPDIIDEGWETKLLHQEVYFFKGIKEQVDPRKLWKEQLYLNCLARLISAGLEYAELLHRLKPAKEAMQQSKSTDETEERLNKIGLVSASQQPKPLTESEQEYADWVKKERAKEGL